MNPFMLQSPYMSQSPYGGSGPSIGSATGASSDYVKQLQAQQAMMPAYHSMPVASLPPAQPFHPAPAGATGINPGAAAAAQAAPSWAQGLQPAVGAINKGIQAYGKYNTQQGLLSDPLGTGGATPQAGYGDGSTGQTMTPQAGYGSGFVAGTPQAGYGDGSSGLTQTPPLPDPNQYNPFANMFSGFGGGGGTGGLW